MTAADVTVVILEEAKIDSENTIANNNGNNNNSGDNGINALNDHMDDTDAIIPNSIQIASDLHLEFRGTITKMKQIEAKSNVLALCGDIGWPKLEAYRVFLNDMALKFKYVLVIAGNHEYYHQEYHQVHDTINGIIREIPSKNVYFLQQSSLDLEDVLPGIRILGCTLWIDYPKKTHGSYLKIVTDFERIHFNKHYTATQTETDTETENKSDGDNDDAETEEEEEEPECPYPKITPQLMTKLHKRDVEWLRKQTVIAKQEHKRVVILTHHAPTDFACNGHNFNKTPVAYSTGYASMESLLFSDPVIAWFSGHTHYNADIVVYHEAKAKATAKKKKKKKNTNTIIRTANTIMNGGGSGSWSWMMRIASNQSGYVYRRLCKHYMNAKVIPLAFNDCGYVIEPQTMDVVLYSDTGRAKNYRKPEKNENVEDNNNHNGQKSLKMKKFAMHAPLQITMIEYKELLNKIHLKKDYVPKDDKHSKDCLLM